MSEWIFVAESGLPPKKDERMQWPLFWAAKRNGEVCEVSWAPRATRSRAWRFFEHGDSEYGPDDVTKYVVAYMPLEVPKHPDKRFNCPKCGYTVQWGGSKETICWPCKLKINWDEEKGWVIANDRPTERVRRNVRPRHPRG